MIANRRWGMGMSTDKTKTNYPLVTHDVWWGLYEDGELISVVAWNGSEPPSLFGFNMPIWSEADYLVMEVRIEPV